MMQLSASGAKKITKMKNVLYSISQPPTMKRVTHFRRENDHMLKRFSKLTKTKSQKLSRFNPTRRKKILFSVVY